MLLGSIVLSIWDALALFLEYGSAIPVVVTLDCMIHYKSGIVIQLGRSGVVIPGHSSLS